MASTLPEVRVMTKRAVAILVFVWFGLVVWAVELRAGAGTGSVNRVATFQRTA